MSTLRRLDIHLPANGAFDTVMSAIKAAKPVDYVVHVTEQKDRRFISVFLREGTVQGLMDNLQSALEGSSGWRMTVCAVEATVPRLEETSKAASSKREQSTREELYAQVASGSKLDRDYVVLVALSTIVAAIGLNSDGVAAVIGAMVIAPLLGPILAFTLGAALGDVRLIRQGALTLLAGIGLVLLVSLLLALIMPLEMQSRELMSRAEVRLDGLALAMAAGGAAALSLTRGSSATLVGVMVAAALLPPGAAIGLFAGSGEWAYALRAALLLSLNIASLIFAALIVFRLRSIRPRGWIEQKHAERAVWLNAGLSAVFLVVAVVLILLLDLGKKISIG
ncbi:TIGR00341 family protein [Hyphomonas sp.]|uniref:TIGR00341 family protein n=1 Tax=Hyphomonas sp. TaxID=87 RepID=UPI00391AF7D4